MKCMIPVVIEALIVMLHMSKVCHYSNSKPPPSPLSRRGSLAETRDKQPVLTHPTIFPDDFQLNCGCETLNVFDFFRLSRVSSGFGMKCLNTFQFLSCRSNVLT